MGKLSHAWWPAPDVIAREITENLDAALAQLGAIYEELEKAKG